MPGAFFITFRKYLAGGCYLCGAVAGAVRYGFRGAADCRGYQ